MSAGRGTVRTYRGAGSGGGGRAQVVGRGGDARSADGAGARAAGRAGYAGVGRRRHGAVLGSRRPDDSDAVGGVPGGGPGHGGDPDRAAARPGHRCGCPRRRGRPRGAVAGRGLAGRGCPGDRCSRSCRGGAGPGEHDPLPAAPRRAGVAGGVRQPGGAGDGAATGRGLGPERGPARSRGRGERHGGRGRAAGGAARAALPGCLGAGRPHHGRCRGHVPLRGDADRGRLRALPGAGARAAGRAAAGCPRRLPAAHLLGGDPGPRGGGARCLPVHGGRDVRRPPGLVEGPPPLPGGRPGRRPHRGAVGGPLDAELLLGVLPVVQLPGGPLRRHQRAPVAARVALLPRGPHDVPADGHRPRDRPLARARARPLPAAGRAGAGDAAAVQGHCTAAGRTHGRCPGRCGPCRSRPRRPSGHGSVSAVRSGPAAADRDPTMVAPATVPTTRSGPTCSLEAQPCSTRALAPCCRCS